MSENGALIFERISAVMGEIEAVGKNKKNDAQHYQFRSIDDVADMLSPILARNKVFIMPNILDIKRDIVVNNKGTSLNYTVLTVQYTFYTTDGSCVTATTVGEGMDSGDKSCNKAMSAAFKYAMIQAFCIPTSEKKDSDYDTHDITAPKPENNKNNSNKSAEKTPSNPVQRPVNNGAQKPAANVSNMPSKFDRMVARCHELWAELYKLTGDYGEGENFRKEVGLLNAEEVEELGMTLHRRLENFKAKKQAK